jgi:hypothetical protein
LLGRFVDYYFGTDDKEIVMKEKGNFENIKLKSENSAWL